MVTRLFDQEIFRNEKNPSSYFRKISIILYDDIYKAINLYSIFSKWIEWFSRVKLVWRIAKITGNRSLLFKHNFSHQELALFPHSSASFWPAWQKYLNLQTHTSGILSSHRRQIIISQLTYFLCFPFYSSTLSLSYSISCSYSPITLTCGSWV